MKIKNKPVFTKKLFLMSTAAVLLAGTLGAYVYMKNKSNSEQATNTSPSVNQVDYGPSKDSDKIQPSSKDKIASDISKNSDATTSNPGATPEPKITITQAAQRDSTLYIRTLIEGGSSGECNLTITQNSSTITKTAPVGVQASYALCQGFNIPVSEFNASGEWKITVTTKLTTGKEATTTSKVTINK